MFSVLQLFNLIMMHFYFQVVKGTARVGQSLTIIAICTSKTVALVIQHITLRSAGGESNIFKFGNLHHRSKCSPLGGYLASIHNKDEDKFLFNLTQPHTCDDCSGLASYVKYSIFCIWPQIREGRCRTTLGLRFG